MWRTFAAGVLIPKLRKNSAQNAVSGHLSAFERNWLVGIDFPGCSAILKKVLRGAILRVNEILHPPMGSVFQLSPFCIKKQSCLTIFIR